MLGASLARLAVVMMRRAITLSVVRIGVGACIGLVIAHLFSLEATARAAVNILLLVSGLSFVMQGQAPLLRGRTQRGPGGDRAQRSRSRQHRRQQQQVRPR